MGKTLVGASASQRRKSQRCIKYQYTRGEACEAVVSFNRYCNRQ